MPNDAAGGVVRISPFLHLDEAIPKSRRRLISPSLSIALISPVLDHDTIRVSGVPSGNVEVREDSRTVGLTTPLDKYFLESYSFDVRLSPLTRSWIHQSNDQPEGTSGVITAEVSAFLNGTRQIIHLRSKRLTPQTLRMPPRLTQVCTRTSFLMPNFTK